MENVSLRFTSRGPYPRHVMTIRRSPSSARLLLEIESFGPNNPDPVRIEMGRAVSLAGRLHSRYGITPDEVVTALLHAGHSARLIAELQGDFFWAERCKRSEVAIEQADEVEA